LIHSALALNEVNFPSDLPERAACPAPVISLLMQMNKGAIAKVSEATCIYVRVISHYSICRYGVESKKNTKVIHQHRTRLETRYICINVTVCYMHLAYYNLVPGWWKAKFGTYFYKFSLSRLLWYTCRWAS